MPRPMCGGTATTRRTRRRSARRLEPAANMLRSMQQKIEATDKTIVAWGCDNTSCRHLITAPGYGPILAAAMAATVVNPAAFTSGRHFATSLGLTPQLEGTGGKVH